MSARPILIQGRPLAGGRLPAICAPLVAATREALLAEARAVAAKQPDLLEWRVDFFQRIAEPAEVLAAGRALRVSNPDRVIFPESGQTKGELADYYQAVAPLMPPKS